MGWAHAGGVVSPADTATIAIEIKRGNKAWAPGFSVIRQLSLKFYGGAAEGSVISPLRVKMKLGMMLCTVPRLPDNGHQCSTPRAFSREDFPEL